MSCACENKKLAKEYERIYRLAKATAKLQQTTVALYKNADGTYDFTNETDINKPIIEYISPY